ncbi:cell division protein [Phenylobacterium sp.]|uniref:cell division protein FtsL n=1 Tax=Phenylobacterium sp. TaxID=1871053 RepID=UPI0035B0FDCF
MSVLNAKIRGFRLIDVIAAALLIALVLGVYLAKTVAGKERAEIASVEQQIHLEKTRIRLMQAEVAHLEEPSRIERLATTYLHMEPVQAKQETTPAGLTEIAESEAKP